MSREHLDLIASLPLFQSLQKEDIATIASFCTVHSHKGGDVLFYEKDSKDAIFYIISGSVKFYKVDRFDNEIFLYKLYSHSLIFNVSKLIDSFFISCYANAEFLEDSLVLHIKSTPFREMIYSNQRLMQKILEESFLMIQQMQCIISRDVVFDGTAKVAHMLVNELETFNKLKKHEIAYMLHIQPETLSRILNKLTRNGTIAIEKNSVEVLNIQELKDIYE
ncbi:Crp/Fnr family transcriptional regulator [Sulfurospirillum barnesii]|uniref:cAMP-binding protein n=1 Tax=Sulfurospirillum barnesii (strain ATCC 700032 / DSM 10660 / SES-3) TaxID=760154 RepID=I3XVV7_SULBS|nr:Crp/Fnr family transcriptional regulator [Sulfurospirillum barnesii]AFL68081.1 cAMP-binding protein [Sulfurospirillum barnesii SES-3]